MNLNPRPNFDTDQSTSHDRRQLNRWIAHQIRVRTDPTYFAGLDLTESSQTMQQATPATPGPSPIKRPVITQEPVVGYVHPAYRLFAGISYFNVGSAHAPVIHLDPR